jgi:hypothetical protein
MTEYNKMAKGSFLSTGQAQIVNLPFQPDWVEFYNYTAAFDGATDQAVTFGRWDSCMPQGTAIIQGYATTALVYDTVPANGISTFYAGQLMQFGPVYQHTATTDFSIAKSGAGGPTTVTTTTAHGLKSGDVVVFQGLYQTSTTGMPQIAGIPFTVTVTGATTFTIPWDTSGSNYTAYNSLTATGFFGSFKQVLYPYLYFPGVAFITDIDLGPTTTIHTTDAHNYVVGQEVAFRMPRSPNYNWGTVELNSLPNIPIPGSPIYAYVIEVVDYNTFVVNVDSSTYTAFTVNPTVASVPGLSYPQVVAVGDVNTGGVQISAGSPLYPSPYYVPIGTTRFNTINGPAIQGAFVNNTAQGFVIGAGAGDTLTTSVLVGTEGDRIHWRAYYHDIKQCQVAPLVLVAP